MQENSKLLIAAFKKIADYSTDQGEKRDTSALQPAEGETAATSLDELSWRIMGVEVGAFGAVVCGLAALAVAAGLAARLRRAHRG